MSLLGKRGRHKCSKNNEGRERGEREGKRGWKKRAEPAVAMCHHLGCVDDRLELLVGYTVRGSSKANPNRLALEHPPARRRGLCSLRGLVGCELGELRAEIASGNVIG